MKVLYAMVEFNSIYQNYTYMTICTDLMIGDALVTENNNIDRNTGERIQ